MVWRPLGLVEYLISVVCGLALGGALSWGAILAASLPV
jgi:hypothetical protein